jgi:DNA-binding GntR family transcriptional regulator
MDRGEGTTKVSEEGQTAAELAYRELRLMAVTFRFRPGERLNEVALARKLNISRTPLREALNRLASEGFLIGAARRGFFARELNVDEVAQLYEMRSILEQGIVRLACERATDQELQELKVFALERDERRTDEPSLDMLHDDEEFHLRIARMTRNLELVRMLDLINARIQFVRWIDLRRRPFEKRRISGELLELLLRRDADGCSRRMATVIARRRDEIVEMIRTGLADIYVRPAED